MVLPRIEIMKGMEAIGKKRFYFGGIMHFTIYRLRFLFSFSLLLLLFLSIASIHAAEYSYRKKIIILRDNKSVFFWTYNIAGGIINDIRHSKPEVTASNLSFDFDKLEKDFPVGKTDKLREIIFGGVKYDVIVPLDLKSLNFINRRRGELYPETPVVFVLGANYNDSLKKYNNNNMTGVVMEAGIRGLITTMLDLHPALKNIYVMYDTTRVSMTIMPLFSEIENAFRHRINFIHLKNVKEDSLQLLASSVKKNSAFIMAGGLFDARNFLLAPGASATALTQELKDVPVYSLSNLTISYGTVCTRAFRRRDAIKFVSNAVENALRGKNPSVTPMGKVEPFFLFDYNVMQKFGISESRLPEDSRIINKPESVFIKYSKLFITIAGSLVILTLIIFILLFTIRKRKKAEEKLRHSEERLNFALKGSDDGLWDWNIETGEIYFSSRFLEILEYRDGELEGNFRTWQNLAYKNDIQNVLESLNNHIKGLSPVFSCEYRMLTKNGSYTWVLSKGKVVAFNIQGKAVRMTGTIRDISDKKQFEIALKESEKKFRSIVEQSSDGILIIDEDGKIEEWNLGLERITGLSKEDVLGKYYWDIQYRFYPEDQKSPAMYEKFKNRIIEALETGQSAWLNTILENKVELADKSNRILQQIIFPIRTDKGFMFGGISRDITGIKESEKALRESEKKFRELVDLLPQVVFEVDLNGNILFTNNNAYKMFGYSREDLLQGVNIFQVIEPSDHERARLNLHKSFKGEITGNEYLAVRKDGSRFPIIVHSTPIIKEEKPMGLRGIIVDITDRKVIEEAVKESEEKYRMLVENQGEGVAIIDLNEKFIYSNPAAEKIFGVTAGGLLGRTLREFTSTEEYVKIAGLSGQRETEVKTSIELDILQPCGEKRNLFVTVTPYIRKEGKIYGSFLVFLDHTERKKAEDQLRKLSQAVYQSPAMIVITNSEGIIEFVNPKFAQVTGYTAEEAIGRKTSILKSGKISGDEYMNLWQTIKSGREWKGEFHNKKKNGELYWEWSSISPITDDKGAITHFLAIKEDITDRKTAQQELIRAKETAEKSDRLKSEFLAQMSHEIRTPLNSILSFTSLLKEELSDKISDDLKSSFRIIDNGGRRLIRTIDLILNMSQIQTGNYELNPSILDLNKDILENVVLEFAALAKEKKLEFNYINKAANTRTMADQYTALQIFTNLVDNALKYTPHGKVEITLYNNSKHDICVEVKDTGIGISQEYMPHLFTSFSQEEMGYTRKFEGNGLGLALVKKYVELNNAKINVESSKGSGTCFTVVFSNSVS